jgi:hypothetical protein
MQCCTAAKLLKLLKQALDQLWFLISFFDHIFAELISLDNGQLRFLGLMLLLVSALLYLRLPKHNQLESA